MKLSFALLCLLTASFLAGCAKQVPAAPPPQSDKQPPDQLSPGGLSVAADESLLRQLQIGMVSAVAVGYENSVAARIEVNENRMVRIGSPVAGRVLSLSASIGQLVSQGESLALVSSTALSEGQLAFLHALTQEQVARRAVERAHILLKAEVIGVAELQRRDAEVAEAEATRDAARDQLILLGMPVEAITLLEKERKIDSRARIAATLTGTILNRNVTVGQIVQPADAMFEVADLSSLWLVANVPSSDATSLIVGQRVEASIGSPAILRTHGLLDFVSSTVNPDTHSVRVRMSLPNPTGRLRPSMLATMTIYGKTEKHPCVPLTAIVRENEQDHVFVASAPKTFTLQPIQLGTEFKSCRPLTGETILDRPIVLDGAFHLNNERRRRAQRSGAGE